MLFVFPLRLVAHCRLPPPPPPPRPRAFFRLRSPTTAAYTPHAAREVSAGKPRHVNGKLPCMSNRTPCSSCTSPASHASPAAGSSSSPDPGCAMLRPETQEGGCFGLDPSGFEIPRVRLQGGCPHQAVRSRDDRGIDRELGTMPHGQAIGDWRGQGERREHTAHGPHKVLLARAAAHETQDRGEKGASRRRAHHKRKRQRVGTHARFLLRPELAVGPVQHVSPQTRVEWGSMPVGPRLQLRQLQASGPQRLVVSGSEVAGRCPRDSCRISSGPDFSFPRTYQKSSGPGAQSCKLRQGPTR